MASSSFSRVAPCNAPNTHDDRPFCWDSPYTVSAALQWLLEEQAGA
jgi:hypothetical protein